MNVYKLTSEGVTEYLVGGTTAARVNAKVIEEADSDALVVYGSGRKVLADTTPNV